MGHTSGFGISKRKNDGAERVCENEEDLFRNLKLARETAKIWRR